MEGIVVSAVISLAALAFNQFWSWTNNRQKADESYVQSLERRLIAAEKGLAACQEREEDWLREKVILMERALGLSPSHPPQT